MYHFVIYVGDMQILTFAPFLFRTATRHIGTDCID